MFEDLAPSFAIEVNGIDVGDAIGELVTSVEYDSTDGGADMMKLQVNNPDLVLTNKKVFQTGNTIKLWAGYGPLLSFIGGCRIEKLRPVFPGSGMPTMEIVAYTADRMMMKNSPLPKREFAKFAAKRPKKGGKIDGRTWPMGSLHSDAVFDKALAYGFIPDIDISPAGIIGPQGVIQKADMSDFDFVNGLANYLGWLFWVDAVEEGDLWTLHFKDPDRASGIQLRSYDFKYDSGDQTSLLSWEGEQLLGDEPTNVYVQVLNPQSGKLEKYDISADSFAPPPQYAGIPADQILQPTETAQEVEIAFGGVAIKVIADRAFSTPAEAKQWLDAWFRQNSDRFYSGRGSVTGPGAETLTARQVHSISGLPEPWPGDYYMTNVNHKWSAGAGYIVDWSGRKIP